METKKMTVANINMVFGEDEKPMIYHMDDVVIPALMSNYERKAAGETRYFFQDVAIREYGQELVLAGLLIKDTILEVKSEYSDLEGLKLTDKTMPSAPFSLFMIFLKNHRMVLVRNQKGSPDLRSFNSTLYSVLNLYVSNENIRRKNNKERLLPRPKNISVTGIKTEKNIREVLKEVEKVESITLKFQPLNGEWDLNPLYESVDETRKNLGSRTGRMIFNSPGNEDAVVKIIEESDGMVETEMKVRYSGDVSLSGTKRRATIKDSQISDSMNVDIEHDLREAYGEIYNLKSDISSLNRESENNIIYYQDYLSKRKK